MSEFGAGLYLHIPFCARVCPYCDFAVRTGDERRRRLFVDDLLREIELYTDTPLCFETIYFGGGTPSSLSPDGLERILDGVRETLPTTNGARIFLEVNPEDVTGSSVAAWKRIGVSTLSLGVQSLDAPSLAFLGRRHDVDDTRRAIELARQAGFDTVSIDLIYGLPGQTASAWGDELDRVASLGVQHISCYQLTIHERTRFGLLEKRGELVQLRSDGQAELFKLTHRRLNASGFLGYEVSQFAAGEEHRSQHNTKYWNHTPYLGLGPSAHSYHDGRRWWNLRRTDPWQDSVRAGRRPVEQEETLDAEALVLEALMTGLRTYRGIDLGRIHARWGLDLREANASLLRRLELQGLIVRSGDRVVPTLDGLAVADGLAASFTLQSAGRDAALESR